MAQGNPVWPSGQFNQDEYHPHGIYSNTYQPQSSFDSHAAHGHGAHQGFDAPNSQVDHGGMYMNWTGNPAMESSTEHAGNLDEYGSGTFSSQNTTNPSSQQPYSGQSYYAPPTTVDDGAGHGQSRQFDYRTSDSHQMWMPSMQGQQHPQQPQQQQQQQQPQQPQQQQQQRPTASPGPGNFPGNSAWRPTSNASPQPAFAQQSMQHYGVPASHPGYPQTSSRPQSTTPSGARPPVQGTPTASADQPMYEAPYNPAQVREGAGRSTPQQADARNSPYQLQATQGMVGGRQYPGFATANGQNQVMYQNQLQHQMQYPAPAGQAVFSVQPALQQQQQQPMAQVQRTLTPTQKHMMTTEGHGSPRNPTAAIQVPHARRQGSSGMPTQVMMQQPTQPTQPAHPTQPTQSTTQANGVAPAASTTTKPTLANVTWNPVPAISTLFYSSSPVQMEPTHKNRGGPFIAQFNERQSNLVPGHPNRLPGEILRDYQAFELALPNPNLNPADSQAMRSTLAQLDQEMLQLTGKKASTYPRQVPTKRSRASGKAKAAKAGKSGPESPESDSSDYSSEDEESLLDKEIRKRLSEPRPKDPIQSAQWDVEKIVWRTDEAPAGWTANAIAEYGRYLKELWDALKQLRTDVKTTTEKAKKIPLKKELEAKSAQVLMAIRTAVESSYDPVLRNMGGNQQLCSIFSNMLRSAYLMEDYSGPLPKTILQLMSKITNIDKTFLLDKLKFQKVLVKYRKSLDSESVAAFEHIISSARDDKDTGDAKPAEKPTEKRSADTNEIASRTSKTEVVAPPKRTPSILAKDLKSASKLSGMKRPLSGTSGAEPRRVLSDSTKALVAATSAKRNRDDEEDSRATKKVATDGPLSKRPRDDDVDSRASKKLVIDGSNGAQSTTKPSSTSTTTAGPLNRARPASSILPGKSRILTKPAPKKQEAPASSTLSTISGLLASISKPKSPPKTRAEPVRAPETAAEKEKRLRKEARRKLRVQWKPDSELEQIRVFEHDAAEDEGRASNMIQDAHDNRSEGQMLKRGISDDEDEMDVDDSEDHQKNGESSLRPWTEPSATDFSSIDGKKRDKSFANRGGLRSVESGQQKYMDDYERRELMVIYTSVSDIPETPKSPPRKSEAASGTATQTRYAQLPSDRPELMEVHRRWAETHQYGPKKALQATIYRIGGGQTTDLGKVVSGLKTASINNLPLSSRMSQQQSAKDDSGSPASFTNMSQADREAKVLQLLQSDAVTKWQDPNPFDPSQPQTSPRTDYSDPKIQADINAFEAVAADFAGKPFPATEPPEHMKNNPVHVQQWQAGYQAEMANKARQDAVERARKMTEDQARQAAAALQQAAQPAAAAQNTQDAQAAAWAAYYAHYGLNPAAAQAQPQQPQQQAYGGGYDYSSVAQVMQALQGGQAAQAQPAVQPSAPAAPSQDSNAQLMSLLSTLGGQSSQPAQQQTPAPAAQGFGGQDATAYWQALMQAAQNTSQAQAQPSQSQSQSQPQTQPKAHQYNHKDRDRAVSRPAPGGDAGFLDYGPGPSDYDYDSRDKGARGRKEKDNFRAAAKDHKGINRALIGTKPCSFWAQGKCAKGDQCTFRHDPNDLK